MIVRLVAFFLKSKRLSLKDRAVLLTEVMHSLDTVPLRAIIQVDESLRILVNGRPVDNEQLLVLRESARALLNSPVRRLVREQVRFAAIDTGFLKNPGDLEREIFYKAALWYDQEQEQLFQSLASQHSTL